MSSALFTLDITTEVPFSKALNPQLFPGRRSINGCPLLRVCVHGVCLCSLLCVCTMDGLNAEHTFWVWVTILGRMSCHFIVFFILNNGDFYIIYSCMYITYSNLTIYYYSIKGEKNHSGGPAEAAPVWNWAYCEDVWRSRDAETDAVHQVCCHQITTAWNIISVWFAWLLCKHLNTRKVTTTIHFSFFFFFLEMGGCCLNI